MTESGPAREDRATWRASDADREYVAKRLHRAALEGRLQPDELDERLALALSCRTFGELDELLVDLPGEGLTDPRGLSSERIPVRRVTAAVAIVVIGIVILALLTSAALVRFGRVSAATPNQFPTPPGQQAPPRSGNTP
jgi:hypothetical protein